MKNYRLKKEAVPFFKENHATSIYDFEVWQGLQVDLKALEEVQPSYLTYGHLNLKDRRSGSLSGWSGEDGKHFYFTIHFPSVKFMESDKFGNGKIVRELMNRIQHQIDIFYQDYLEDSNLKDE